MMKIKRAEATDTGLEISKDKLTQESVQLLRTDTATEDGLSKFYGMSEPVDCRLTLSGLWKLHGTMQQNDDTATQDGLSNLHRLPQQDLSLEDGDIATPLDLSRHGSAPLQNLTQLDDDSVTLPGLVPRMSNNKGADMVSDEDVDDIWEDNDNERKEHSRGRTGPNHPSEAKEVLLNWMRDHIHNPYPCPQAKRKLAKESMLSERKISQWFINARRREYIDLSYELGFIPIRHQLKKTYRALRLAEVVQDGWLPVPPRKHRRQHATDKENKRRTPQCPPPVSLGPSTLSTPCFRQRKRRFSLSPTTPSTQADSSSESTVSPALLTRSTSAKKQRGQSKREPISPILPSANKSARRRRHDSKASCSCCTSKVAALAQPLIDGSSCMTTGPLQPAPEHSPVHVHLRSSQASHTLTPPMSSPSPPPLQTSSITSPDLAPALPLTAQVAPSQPRACLLQQQPPANSTQFTSSASLTLSPPQPCPLPPSSSIVTCNNEIQVAHMLLFFYLHPRQDSNQ